MGDLVNQTWTTRVAWLVASVIVGLNVFLLVATFQGGIL
jgi:Mn2+/Fe2+ NRAMP family transporter